ncbi:MULTISPECIES: geranylgeranyl pyrophosphate synthase [Lysinibacillus]|uniref:Geranylgeranyl pyrophosphate synthase n=1 Tax=Lysinibacillus antri TaxID=2498145 RepID=A0A432LID1_9BACI|nr:MULTISPECIES: geranylgeranyl pyrophosphate synthase [Lysinibacillus]RUL57062.1 geranylgeranyl pyrophosphate synthase [Lysinibacillus antri]TSI03305.1 geranylgeranyl pyrophosphate synthase [Lysinibacillus sp. BW-2-10]
MSKGRVNIPEWFELDELSVINTIVSKENETYGTLIASDNFEQNKPYKPTVRLYLIRLNNNLFEIEKEIGSFSFETKIEATEFSTNFPHYSAVDLVHNIHNKQVKMAL